MKMLTDGIPPDSQSISPRSQSLTHCMSISEVWQGPQFPYHIFNFPEWAPGRMEEAGAGGG